MIKKRPEDKSILKYWLPYGFMRRFLARRYGMVVRNGVLGRGRPTQAESKVFNWRDVLPLWAVMWLQSKKSAAGAADNGELAGLKSAVRRLAATIRSERYESACQIDQLKIQNLQLQMQLKQVAQLFALKGSSNSPLTGGNPPPAKLLDVQKATGNFVKPAGSAWNAWSVLNDLRLEVDMICSIGGDCIAASQQKLRGLRHYSLPFDWCFSDGEDAIRRFAEELDRDFEGFAKKENLRAIPSVRFGYKDIATGYNFMHHFQADVDAPGEYERFRAVLDRRLNRFRAEISRSHSILFILSRTFRLDESCLRKVQEVCQRKWPDKRFYFILATYNSKDVMEIQGNDFAIIRIARDRTRYDIHEKVFEWSFLDNVKYTEETTAYFKTLKMSQRPCPKYS